MRQLSVGYDKTFVWLVVGLTLFGLIILMSASGPLGYQRMGDSLYFFKRQLLLGLLPGTALFLFCAWCDYRKLRLFALPALILSIVLLILVYVDGIGLERGGSLRWVEIAGFSFQPSEFVKLTFLIYVAAWLASRRERDAQTLNRGLIPFLSALGLIMLLLIKQPNTGSMMVVAGSALLTYFVAGAPFGWFVGLGAMGAGLIAVLVKLTPYRAARFMTFLHPELDPNGIGYHINQAFLAIGSGGLFGVGYGHSRQKFLYLPEAAGDSIFAVFAEEMGFVIVVLFLVGMSYLVWRCLMIAKKAPDAFGTFFATGVGAWIALQAFFNVASMIGLMPMTGVTLPFVSYGNSAFLALSAACGFVVSVSREQRGRV